MAMRALNVDDVVVVGGNLIVASAEEVDALESRLWIRFPSGYRDYMERLGEGCLGGTFVRIYPPWRIEKELVEWRRRIQKYWFWDETLELLPKDRAMECVIIGDTVGGDELVFHPCRPERLFVLPRDSEGAFEAGSNLLEAIEWMCSSGQLVDPFSEREFEPFDTRKIEEERKGAEAATDKEGESLDDIVELGKRWAERHSTREKHADQVEELGRRWAEEHSAHEIHAETELTLEAIVLAGNLNCPEGYLLRYSILDSQSRRKLGVFQISDSGYPYSEGCYSYIAES